MEECERIVGLWEWDGENADVVGLKVLVIV